LNGLGGLFTGCLRDTTFQAGEENTVGWLTKRPVT
jgi:hypothetical protein